MTDSPLNLLTLPVLHRNIIVHLAREGPANADTLAETFDKEPEEIQLILDELATKGKIQISPDGLATDSLGRTRRRTLPARLWPALLANNRLYSTQEIATLSTAVPILQFARAKMSEFADHGPNHVLRVKSFATQLGYVIGLSEMEQQLLRAASLFHDVGNVVDRERHHIISQVTVQRLTDSGKLPFSAKEAEIVGLLCRWHRKEYDPERFDELNGETIRTGLLASILRVSDAMDIDQKRSDYTDRFSEVLEFFYPGEMPYWTSLEEILGLRIQCKPDINLQVLSNQDLQDNMQFNMLRKDLQGTPLPWTVEQVTVSSDKQSQQQALKQSLATGVVKPKKALLVFPFDCHSLIMAALSRRHLRHVGVSVELLCYPDTTDGSAWLWREALTQCKLPDYSLLIVIGDRPAPSITNDLLNTIGKWRSADTDITLLNRHEANWSRLPQILELGVEVYLGGDWAYFWGNEVWPDDLEWGHIAAICTREPTQLTAGISSRQEAIARGLLKAVFEQADQQIDEIEGWARLSQSILRRIEANDYEFFANQSHDFSERFASAPQAPVTEGIVLWYEEAPGDLPQTYYWVLENAIEQHGRLPERGIRYKAPYALATWQDGNKVELLAINHWQEEEAIPIRLLYPTELGPQPEGNENTIRVRLPAEQADAIIRALIKACNNQQGSVLTG